MGDAASGIEIQACARCGGRLRVLASIEDPAVIARILSHLKGAAAQADQPEFAPLAARALRQTTLL